MAIALYLKRDAVQKKVCRLHVLIITYDEYLNIPYIQNYENNLAEAGHTYDIVLWDRRGIPQQPQANHFVFQEKTGCSKLSKIRPFIAWRKFVCGYLKKTHYDKLIILTTIPGILISDFLMGKYKNQFLFDIRDYTYESILPYKWLVNLIVKCSEITSISSSAFMKFINPKHKAKIVLSHNLCNVKDAVMETTFSRKEQGSYVIGFVGGIRYYAENTLLLRQLGNRREFTLKYIGKTHPGCDLRTFCNENSIRNVAFYSAYNNSEKFYIYESIDFINALYGCKSLEVTLALPNKLYDCILFKKPILVSQNTYLSQLIETYNLGLSLDLEKDDIATRILQYINKFEAKKFNDGCRAFLEVVQLEHGVYLERLKEFFNE